MKSIGLKITLIMLCVVLLGIAATVGVAIVISSDTITTESLGKLRSETGRQALIIDEWLVYQKATVSALGPALSQINDYSKESLFPMFSAVLNANSVYQDVYMGFPDNTAIMGTGYPIEEEYHWWKATERSWYKAAMVDTSKAGITSLYVDVATGDLCITVSHAVVRDGEVLGVVAIDILVNVLQDQIFAANLEDTGYTMLLDSNGDILIHPDKEYAPNEKGEFNNLDTFKKGVYSGLWKKITAADDSYKYKDATGLSKYYTSSTLDATGWHLVTVVPEKIITQHITHVILIVIPVAVAILVLAGFIAFFVIRNLVSKPLVTLSAFMHKAGTTGDITLKPEDITLIGRLAQSKDELGQAISDSAMFVGHVTNVAKELEVIADGDLSHAVTLLSDADTMGNSLKKMSDSLNDMFTDINASTKQVSTGSKQVADGAQSLAQGATEQAASIEELSSSIAEIAERTKANAAIADKTSRLSDTIKDNAEKGNRQMGEMIAAVNQINDASRSISKIIKTIDDIAFQTNILALNAAVEAARAGQHGKGFAVVAEEVRNLASKSAEAAKDTGDMIQNSMEKAEFGARIAGETAASLKEIVSGINESSHLIEEIAKSSENQSSGISQINIGIDQVAQVVQQNSATAEESAAASEEMSSQADILQQLIARFKLKGGSGVYHGLSQTVKPAQKHTAKPAQPAAAPADFSMDFDKY